MTQPGVSRPRTPLWGHVWRLLLVLAISAVSWSGYAPWQWEHARWWFALDLVLGLTSLGLVTRRRRHPFAVALATAVLSSVSTTAGGPATLALASLATWRRWRGIAVVAAASVAASIPIVRLDPVGGSTPWVTVPFVLAVVGVTVGWGMYIGSRRELLATLRERADRAESEQASRLAQARAGERTRIAREMHDVLAHRISLVTVHAGALVYRDDLTPAQMRETAGIIQSSSQQALAELREVLGVLRDDPGDAAPEPPQPSASDLGDLLDEAREHGLRLDTEVGLPLEELPGAVGRTLYRIVQEGLTNARKHAPGTRVTLRLNGSVESGVDVLLRNPLQAGASHTTPPPSGLGLVGLGERGGAGGGTAEPRGHGAARVRPAGVATVAGMTTARPPRVLIVDDDALVRAGLSLMLGGSPALEVVGQAADGREAVAAVRAGGVDLVLMDLRMPVLDGIDATTALRALPDPPHVIVLTTFDADDHVVRALAAGANGFLLKDTRPQDIVDAITRVVAGEPILSPSITQRLIQQVTDQRSDGRSEAARERVARLTDREREVAVAIGRGASNAEIAQRLHVSLATVKAHISRILTKLEATNRVQVAICVHDAGDL